MSGKHVHQTWRDGHVALAAVLRSPDLHLLASTTLDLTADVEDIPEKIHVTDLDPGYLP